MGKTFRRGGSESGNYSYGKSIRDKRQRGTNRTSQGDYSNELMYISHSEYNTFNTTNIEFEEDVNYGIYNGNVYMLEEFDWSFPYRKARKALVLKDQ